MILARLRDHYRQHASDWAYLYHEPRPPYATLVIEGDAIHIRDTDREYWLPQTGRSSDVFPAVLVDGGKYYVGLKADGSWDMSADPREQYLDALDGLITDMPHPALVRWNQVLHTRAEAIAEEIVAYMPKTDRHKRKMVPIIDGTPLALPVGDSPTPLHDCIAEAALQLWMERKADAGELSGQCMVCEEHKPIAQIHPKVKLASETVSLANFNKEAFQSYGREQSTGAPVCPTCALEAHAGVGLLTGSAVSTRAARRFGAIEFLVLSDGTDEPDAGAGDGLLLSFAKNIDRPSALLDALDQSLISRDHTVTGQNLHVLAFEGMFKRLRPILNETIPLSTCMENVRAFCERSLEGVPLEHMVQAAHQVSGFGKPEGDSLSLRDSKISSHHRRALLHLVEHVLLGRPLPRTLLTRWHTRRKARQVQLQRSEIALIRLYIADMEHETHPAYLLGKVLFHADDVYRQSLTGDPDRYASTRYWRRLVDRPKEAFGELARQLQSHLAKSDVYGQEFDRAAAAMPMLPDQFTAEEHGLFALGYYHAREKHFDDLQKRNGTPDDA